MPLRMLLLALSCYISFCYGGTVDAKRTSGTAEILISEVYNQLYESGKLPTLQLLSSSLETELLNGAPTDEVLLAKLYVSWSSVHEAQGKSHEAMTNRRRALAIIEANGAFAEELEDHWFWANLGIADLHYAQGEIALFEKQIEVLDTATTNSTSAKRSKNLTYLPEIALLKARVSMEQGELARANELLEVVIQDANVQLSVAGDDESRQYYSYVLSEGYICTDQLSQLLGTPQNPEMQAAIAALEENVARAPYNASLQFASLMAQVHLASSMRRNSQLGRAEEVLNRVAPQLYDLCLLDKSNVSWGAGMGACYQAMGDVALHRGHYQEALAHAKDAERLMEFVQSSDPASYLHRIALAEACCLLGDISAQQKDRAQAERYFKRALDYMQDSKGKLLWILILEVKLLHKLNRKTEAEQLEKKLRKKGINISQLVE